MAQQPQDHRPPQKKAGGGRDKAVISLPGASSVMIRLDDVTYSIRPSAVVSAHFRVLVDEAQEWMATFTRGLGDEADSGMSPTREELRELAAQEKPLAKEIVQVLFAADSRERALEAVDNGELTFGQLYAVLLKTKQLFESEMVEEAAEAGVPPTRSS